MNPQTVRPIDYRFLEAADRAEIESLFKHDCRTFAADHRALHVAIDTPLGELLGHRRT